MPRQTDSLPAGLTETKLRYTWWDGREGECLMRTYRTKRGEKLIVLTETDDNPGASVTNAAEQAFRAALELTGGGPDVLLFEHYPGRGTISETLSRVTLDTKDSGVCWRPVNIDDFLNRLKPGGD